MGRFNWMTRALCAFSVILHVSSASRATAFDLNDVRVLERTTMSNICTILKDLVPPPTGGRVCYYQSKEKGQRPAARPGKRRCRNNTTTNHY